MKISRRSFMSGLHATFLTTALASITPSAYAMESPGMDSLDVLVSMHYFLSAPDNGTILWPKESVIAEIILCMMSLETLSHIMESWKTEDTLSLIII